jgi:hypothetical protein
MNPKHASALLLIAGGAFLILVGGILWALTTVGGVVLAVGLVTFLVGIYMYRLSDHRLLEVRDPSGKVLEHRFSVLSPIMVILFALCTGLLVWSYAEYGLDLTRPKAYVRWAIFAVLFLSAAGAAGARWFRGMGTPAKAEQHGPRVNSTSTNTEHTTSADPGAQHGGATL